MEQDIRRFIEDRIPELQGKIYPVFTTDLHGLSITYAFADISRDHVNESQLELRIIHRDYDMCQEVAEKLAQVLGMESDDPFVVYGSTRFKTTMMSGGGALYNEGPQMWEVTKYFLIDWRRLNGR